MDDAESLQELKNEILRVAALVDQKNRDIEEMRKIKDHYAEVAAAHDAEITRLKAEGATHLELALGDAHTMKACWNAACHDIADRDAEIARLKMEVGSAKNLALNRGQRIDELIDESEQLRARLAEAERERDEARLRINTLLEDISRAIAERDELWEPMECGHPNACYSYLGPADNSPAPDEKLPKPCLACRYGDAAEAKGVRMGLERAEHILKYCLGRLTEVDAEAYAKINNAIDAIRANIAKVEKRYEG